MIYGYALLNAAKQEWKVYPAFVTFLSFYMKIAAWCLKIGHGFKS